jgi:uncharacterized membrane protein
MKMLEAFGKALLTLAAVFALVALAAWAFGQWPWLGPVFVLAVFVGLLLWALTVRFYDAAMERERLAHAKFNDPEEHLEW